MYTKYTKIVDLIDADLGEVTHEASSIQTRNGASVSAVAMCGKTFSVKDDWAKGFGGRDRVNCPDCKDNPVFLTRTP